MRQPGEPPRLARRLLEWLLPATPVGRSVLGDVLEEFHARPAGWLRDVRFVISAIDIGARYLPMRWRKTQGGEPPARGRWLLDAGSDFLFAVRLARRRPMVTTTAVLTLALGVGVNSAIFTAVNGVLLKPLPFLAPSEIVRVLTWTTDSGRSSHSAAEFRDIGAEQRSLAALAGYRTLAFSVSAPGGDSAPLSGAYVTREFFDVLGVPAMLGRTFSRTDDGAAGGRDVVLTQAACRQIFGDRRDVIGQSLRISGEAYTLVGVVPTRSAWPDGSQIWVLSARDVPPAPLEITDAAADRDVRYFDAIARLEPGVTFASAQQDLSRVATLVQSRQSADATPRDIRIVSLVDDTVGDVRPVLTVLQAAVLLVLLIACANVASLQIASAGERRREIALRTALGAGRARLVRQLLTESTLVSLAGGVAGLLLGAWLTTLLKGMIPDVLPRTDDIVLDRTVTIVTLLAALATGTIFGLLPALRGSRGGGPAELRASGRTVASGGSRMRSVLVIAEIALTLVLLAGAGLLVSSLIRLQRVESGMSAHTASMMGMILPPSRYPTASAQVQLYTRMIESLSQKVGVESVGIGFPGPLRGDNANATFIIERGESARSDERPFGYIGSVSGGFFETMGIPLVSGRTFTDADREGAPLVAIVSRTTAAKFWPGESALGKRLRMDESAAAPWTTVVGVSADVRQLGLHHDPPALLYFPYQQWSLPFTNVIVRASGSPQEIASLLRTEIAAIDPTLTAGNVSTLGSVLNRSLNAPTFRTTLLSGFAIVALLLAAVGVYGLIGHSVAGRTREIGIRVALGAQPGQVLGPLVREGLSLALAGVVLGLALALAGTQLLSTFLFGIQASDPMTFLLSASVLTGVAALASYIPARRALAVDPLDALRSD